MEPNMNFNKKMLGVHFGNISVSCPILTEWRDGALSRLLWLDTDGVRCRRGGNDLLWCCSCECNELGVISKGPRNASVLTVWAGTDVGGWTVCDSFVTLQSCNEKGKENRYNLRLPLVTKGKTTTTTSVDEFDSFCESQLPEARDGGGVHGLSSDLSSDFSDARRTAPTRSLAIRDQDSRRLWASQQAAGPKPLIFCILNFLFTRAHSLVFSFSIMNQKAVLHSCVTYWVRLNYRSVQAHHAQIDARV